MPGPGAAAAADELGAAVGPGEGVLQVLGGCQAVEDPVRRCPVAGLGVGPGRAGEAAADDLDRVRDHLGIAVHHGDRGQRRAGQGGQQVLEAATVAQFGRSTEGAVGAADRGDAQPHRQPPVSVAACRAARP